MALLIGEDDAERKLSIRDIKTLLFIISEGILPREEIEISSEKMWEFAIRSVTSANANTQALEIDVFSSILSMMDIYDMLTIRF